MFRSSSPFECGATGGVGRGGAGLGGGTEARDGAGFDGLRGGSNDDDVGFVTVGTQMQKIYCTDKILNDNVTKKKDK